MNGPPSQGAWKIETIIGIPIEVHFSWFIVFGLLTWSLSTFYFPQAAPDFSGMPSGRCRRTKRSSRPLRKCSRKMSEDWSSGKEIELPD